MDAWRFETAVGAAAGLPPERAAERLGAALALWRGPAYADFADADWTRAERARLGELRLGAVEQLAAARLGAGRAAEAVPDLQAHGGCGSRVGASLRIRDVRGRGPRCEGWDARLAGWSSS